MCIIGTSRFGICNPSFVLLIQINSHTNSNKQSPFNFYTSSSAHPLFTTHSRALDLQLLCICSPDYLNSTVLATSWLTLVTIQLVEKASYVSIYSRKPHKIRHITAPPPWNWDRGSGQCDSDIYWWSTIPVTKFTAGISCLQQWMPVNF